MVKKRNQKKLALFSVPIHVEMESFARALTDAGWQIIATPDASTFLRKNGIDTMDVSEFTKVHKDYGFPSTLHPKMEAALTGDAADLTERIELVYDIPYGIEVGNDVGGRTLLALAAKGKRIPIMNPEDMRLVVDCISQNKEVSPDFKDSLRDKANYEISRHYLNLASIGSPTDNFSGIMGTKHYLLQNGENMYQVPATLFDNGSDDPLSICNFKQIAGEPPCFTNIADLDSIIVTLCKLNESLKLNGFEELLIAIASKHGNPCGVGLSENPPEALEKALLGNPMGIWGGEVITNFPIDGGLAQILKRSNKRKDLLGSEYWMLDLVAAPNFTDEGKEILGSRRRKLFVNNRLSLPSLRKKEYHIRPVRGGFLKEPQGDYILNLNQVKWAHQIAEKENMPSIIIAWAVAYSSFHGGNEVALTKNNALIGVGGGPSTHAAVKTAINRARDQDHDVKDSYFSADAFFPFTDIPEILSKSGCSGGIVPSGGKREKEVIDYFKIKKMSVGIIPEEYRGFCRH